MRGNTELRWAAPSGIVHQCFQPPSGLTFTECSLHAPTTDKGWKHTPDAVITCRRCHRSGFRDG